MLKKELIEKKEALESDNVGIRQVAERLNEQNETLQMYVNQLRGKLQEVGNQISQYERTILVMSNRLKEKDDFISEQNMEQNRREQ